MDTLLPLCQRDGSGGVLFQTKRKSKETMLPEEIINNEDKKDKDLVAELKSNIHYLKKKIKSLKEENGVQFLVIDQLKKLLQTTPKIPHCDRSHRFCKIIHYKYS